MIELIVTIAITGVLLALAVPTFRETTMNSQRASRVNELMTDLNYARTQAVSLRQPLTICRSNNSSAALPTCGAGAGWEEGWIVFVDSNNSGTLEAADATQDVNGDGAINGDDAAPLRRKGPLISADQLALTDATKKFTIRGNGLPALGVVTRVTFLASGTSANTGTLVACDSRNDVSKGRAVIVAAGGRVRSTTASGSTCQR